MNTYRNHLALSRHVGGAVAQAQLGLQGVEVGLELSLLLHTWRLVLTPAKIQPLLTFLLYRKISVCVS